MADVEYPVVYLQTDQIDASRQMLRGIVDLNWEIPANRDLRDSIREVGMLDNLVVTANGDGIYNLVSGGRRLMCIRSLSSEEIAGLFPYGIPAHVIPEEHADQAEIICNRLRVEVPMVRQIQYVRAKCASWQVGEDPELLARKLFCSVDDVKRMFNVCFSPVAYAAFLAGRVTLPQANALATSKSAKEQEQILSAASEASDAASGAKEKVRAAREVINLALGREPKRKNAKEGEPVPEPTVPLHADMAKAIRKDLWKRFRDFGRFDHFDVQSAISGALVMLEVARGNLPDFPDPITKDDVLVSLGLIVDDIGRMKSRPKETTDK